MSRLREPVHYGLKRPYCPGRAGGQWRNRAQCGTRVSKGPTAVEVTLPGVDWKSYHEHKLNRPKQTLGCHEPWNSTRIAVWPKNWYDSLLDDTPHWSSGPHRITSDLKPSGTNNRLGGHPGGGVTPSKAVRTFDSTSHVSVETTSLSGMIHSGVDRRSDWSKMRDNASGLMFLEPGR